MWPFCISASETPRNLTIRCNSAANARTSAALFISGSVTISKSGVPVLFKSTCEKLSAVCRFLPASSYLVILRQVRVVIALSVPLGEFCYFAVKGKPDKDSIFNRLLIHHGQNTGHTKTHRTDPAVGLPAKFHRTAAEHFALRAQLHVDFQTNDYFIINLSHLN
jgi:hypothetical protein